ncbi:MAG: acetyl-CoA carboxylase biotin carboxylase subunit, partial [Xanthomonadales bacterium]|nr:acetyl-CoA carboxylase biotin carboxylase subunit [Xanthomonadales bacterium]
PSPGLVKRFHAPGGPGIRVDTHLYDDYRIPPNYDAMVAKVIAHGPDRATAIARMRVALSELVVEGVKTNTPLQQRNMVDQMFQVGGANIHYLERRLAQEKDAQKGRG